MPLTSQAVDALGVVTICLVVLSVLLGLLCIIYTLYFHARIQSSAFTQLGYFSGPWVIRIIFVVFGIFWGAGEVVRLSIFRQEGKVFHSLGQKWQEDICKIYILSNLGFTEPCLFLTMSFLLRASLKWRGSAILNPKWNFKTTGYVLLYCIPIFVLDLLFVLVAPKLVGKHKLLREWPSQFTRIYILTSVSGRPVIACTYPLLCTILHGLFATVLTTYMLLLGRRMVVSVINKGLQKRVYVLIFLVSSFLPLRVLLLGFSVLARPEHFLFEALAFCGFLVLLSCIIVGIFMLVYLPIADSLALSRGRGSRTPETDSLSLISANPSHHGTSSPTSLERDSDSSTKRGSISFRTMIRDEPTSSSIYEEEMSTFSPGFRLLSATSPGSPAS
ncbi:hypothetical protein RND81_04G213800 [Saponaria officinalis]|uniref:Uncharacterized protein n=1 Tax=Saponaria officinalis TaxID=3572 RepID=A0AAW1LGS9_SAPOF